MAKPAFLNDSYHWTKIQDAIYEAKIGGPRDTAALTLFGFAALSGLPAVQSMAGWLSMALPFGLSTAGASLLAERALIGWREHFLLKNTTGIQSSRPDHFDPVKNPGLCLGFTTDRAEPVFIPDRNLFRHMWMMGMSGMGKTVAGSLLMFQQIQRGGGVLFIDGKLDADNILSMYQFCAWAGRSHEFFVINPGDASNSNTYNPIHDGDPDEVSSRILSAIPSTEGNAGSDYYKQSSNEALVIIIGALQAAGLRYNFFDLSVLMNNAEAMNELKSRLESVNKDCDEMRNLNLFLDRYRVPANDSRNPLAGQLDMKRMKDVLGGIAGRMFTFGTGSFGKVLNDYDPEVRMYPAIRDGMIIYMALPTMGKDVAANNFGKMAMGDFRTALSWLQRNKLDRPKIPFMAFMDEAASYVTESWAVVFEQARSAGVFLLPALQTDSGFKAVSDDFAERVIGNTTTKVFFRVGTIQSAQTASDLIGEGKGVTRTVSSSTGDSNSSQFVQVSPQRTSGKSDSDGISEKEEAKAIVSPEILMGMKIGEAMVLYEGNRLYNVSVPVVNLTPAAIAAIGPLRINRRRYRKNPSTLGLNYMDHERASRLLQSGVQADRDSRRG